MKQVKLFSLSFLILTTLFLVSFVGVTPAHAISTQHQGQKISLSLAHPDCSPSVAADSGAGTAPGYSIGLPVWWSCGGTGEYIQYGWGDGTGWFYYGNGYSNGSATFYHAWSHNGSYTVTWRLWVYYFGTGTVLAATTYTYVTICC